MNLPIMTNASEAAYRSLSGYIYCVELSNGLIKIGMSRNSPLERIKSAAAYGSREHGATIVSSWVSDRHFGYIENERKLIAFILDYRYGGYVEWCEGIGVADIKEFICELDIRTVANNDDKELIAREERRNARFADAFFGKRQSKLDSVFSSPEFTNNLRIASAIAMNFTNAGIDSFSSQSGSSERFSAFELSLALLMYKTGIEDVADLIRESILTAEGAENNLQASFDYAERIESLGAARLLKLKADFDLEVA